MKPSADQLAHVAHGRGIAEREPELGLQALLTRQRRGPPGVAKVVGHRLLAEHVLAGVERRPGQLEMRVARRADVDEVDVVALDQRPMVGGDGRDREALRGRVRQVRAAGRRWRRPRSGDREEIQGGAQRWPRRRRPGHRREGEVSSSGVAIILLLNAQCSPCQRPFAFPPVARTAFVPVIPGSTAPTFATSRTAPPPAPWSACSAPRIDRSATLCSAISRRSSCGWSREAKRPSTRRSGAHASKRPSAFRASLGLDATAYRLVHGEADLLPSLIVDRYDDCAGAASAVTRAWTGSCRHWSPCWWS